MIFDTIVVLSFLLQVFNLWELGRGRIRYLLMVTIYSMFAIIEGWMALTTGRHSYFLFVALSVFGVLQGVRGYVRTTDLFARGTSWFTKLCKSLHKDVASEETEARP